MPSRHTRTKTLLALSEVMVRKWIRTFANTRAVEVAFPMAAIKKQKPTGALYFMFYVLCSMFYVVC